MRPSRARLTDVSRTCRSEEVERRLEELLRRSGETELLRLRDEIHTRSEELSAQKQAKELDKIIGALLGTRTADLRSTTGRARMQGQPFDLDRLELFRTLFEDLESTSPVIRSVEDFSYTQTTLAFFEAYFSNFIEGTEFQVNDAVDIIFKGEIPETRHEDAHDILGTYRIVSSSDEMTTTPSSSKNLLELLQKRHSLIMGGRPDKNPGIFKAQANRAGSTLFVAPDLVVGTLCHGYELYKALSSPFSRAVFMMFLVSEVHPFDDGNGRLARIMMNAELVSAREWRIVIPTIYRNNYLSGLKALSQSKRTDALINILDFAQKFTRSVPWNNLESARESLEQTNAFRDPGEAEERRYKAQTFYCY
jgi:Fic family protein